MNGVWISNQYQEGKGTPSTLFAPWDNTPLLEFQHCSPEQIEQAIQLAHMTFSQFSKMPAYLRRDVLIRITNGLRDNLERFATTIAKEAAKPIQDARNEVNRAVFTFQLASEEATRFAHGEWISLDQTVMSKGRSALVKRFPRGVVLGITPFNFPLNLVAHKVAPAIACGCPIVLKPAPQTPMTALMLAELCKECGLPENVLQVIVCEGNVIQPFVNDERFGLVSFTGSEQVGWLLRRQVQNPLALELGGNGAVLIDETYTNLNYAVQRCLIGSYSYAGQICISVQRIYVVESIYQDFVEMFIKEIPTYIVNDPLLLETKLSCMIHEQAAIRAENWLSEAVQAGAKILFGGYREKNRFQPTLITQVPKHCKLYREEVFAPIAIIEKVPNWKQGLIEINDSKYGLQAGYFSSHLERLFYAFNHLEVGGLVCNDVPTFRSDTYPYGGVKRSGLGREGVKYAMEEMSERKVMVLPPDRDV
ncbi:MAG: aldehyde dehydrogenase family protein [bacterium]|nr:aldehyde dehydrogenase family protein [bacterium]